MPTYKFYRHPRFLLTLAALRGAGCNVLRYTLFGHFAKIEEWLGDEHPDGVLTGVSDTIIEAAAGWIDEPAEWAGKLAAALRESGLIHQSGDGETRFRGWPEHATRAVKVRLARDAERKNRVFERENADCAQVCAHVRTCAPRGEESRGEERRGENTSAPPEPAHQKKDSASKPAPSAGGRSARKKGAGAGGADAAHDAPANGDGEQKAYAALFRDGLTPEAFQAMHPTMAARLVAQTCGCDGSFSDAISKAAGRDSKVFPALFDAFKSFYRISGPVKSPGAWMRGALRVRGVSV